MDRFSSIYENKTENQKVLIGLGFSALALLLLAVSYFLTTPKQISNPNTSGNSAAGQNPSASPGASSDNSFPKSSSLPKANVPEGWETYKYSDYQISYPADFTPQPGVISGGGVSLTLQQKDQTALQSSIEMQVYDSKTVPLQRVSAGLSDLGYAKSALTIGGINAQRFSGSILVSTSSANLHTIAVIFENKNRTFKIQLDYSSESKNDQVENIFNNIVSSFSFN